MHHHLDDQGQARDERGFSLLELMVALAIVAILVSVAYPSYLNSVRKGRRSDAVGALTSLQQAQERWRANSQQYTGTLTDLVPSLAASSATMPSPNGYYTISIDSAHASDYVIAAQANAGTSQATDTQCTTMRLQYYNGAIAYYGCNSCASPTGPSSGPSVSDPAGCWAK